MKKLKILNKKEIKKIILMLKKQFGFKDDLDYAFLKSEKDRIYIVNANIAKVDLERLKINSIGLYIGTLAENKIRLSIEGTQIIGPKSKRNIIELDKEQMKFWLRGEDIAFKGKEKGFVILKNKHDFLGCGKISNERILNYVAKTRRINSI